MVEPRIARPIELDLARLMSAFHPKQTSSPAWGAPPSAAFSFPVRTRDSLGRWRREGELTWQICSAPSSARRSTARKAAGGIKGAIEGTIAEYAIRTLTPIVATYALGWAVQYGVRKGWRALIGHDPVD